MPLKLKDFETKGQVAALNKWADYIEQHLGATNTRINFVQTVAETPIVIPPAPTVSDGLVHGDPIWDVDSAYSWFRDDFNYIGTIPADVWYTVTSGAANLSGAPPHIGVWRSLLPGASTTTTSTPQTALILCQTTGSANGGIGSTPWLDYPGWKVVFIFHFPINNSSSATLAAFNTAHQRFYAGLMFPTAAQPNSCTARPPAGVWLRFDTDATAPAISDTTFQFEAVSNDVTASSISNTQGTVVDSGVTPTANTWYRLEMTCQTAGIVQMSLNGSAPVSITMPTYSKVCAGGQYASSGGYGWVYSGLAEMPFAIGSKITVSGATHSPFNGTFTSITEAMSNFQFNFLLAGTQTTVAESITIAGYPALLPFLFHSNDTSGNSSTGIMEIDFYSHVWNSGLAASPLSLSQTNSRWTVGS